MADARILGLHFGARDIVLHYLGIHAFFGDAYAMSINDSFWFITLIVYLYVLFALLRRFIGRPDWILFFGALASITIALGYFWAGQAAVFSHLALRVPGFFLGLLIGQLLKAGRLEIPISWALAAALGLVLYLPYVFGIIFASFWEGLALIALYAFLLRPAFPAAVRRVLSFIGDHSLEIFLIHQPLIREYNVFFQSRWFGVVTMTSAKLIMGMAVGLAVTIVASAGIHALLRRLPMRGSGRPSPGPA